MRAETGATASRMRRRTSRWMRAAARCRAIPNSRWEVGGYTSSTGTRAGNRRLSRARARAVVRYLISRGVAARALRAFGYGPANPVVPNNTADGRAQNRRVEVKRIR